MPWKFQWGSLPAYLDAQRDESKCSKSAPVEDLEVNLEVAR